MENFINFEELKKEIPFKWRIQSISKNGESASCVAYIDARDVMSILDEVIGAENWQSDYKEIKGNLYAGIGLKINDEWIWKWDCGIESKTEAEKGESSDAFKRAGVKWGIGRFLYDKEIQWVKVKDKKPINDKGQVIYNLTEYLNNKNKLVAPEKVTDISSKLPSWVNDKFSQCNTLNALIDTNTKILESKPHFEKMKEYKALYSQHEERIDFIEADMK